MPIVRTNVRFRARSVFTTHRVTAREGFVRPKVSFVRSFVRSFAPSANTGKPHRTRVRKLTSNRVFYFEISLIRAAGASERAAGTFEASIRGRLERAREE